MSVRHLLRIVLLVSLAFATHGGSGLVASVATVTFVAAGCGPSASDEEAAEPEQSLADIARLVESAVNDGKADSPERPTILGDILPNLPVQGRFVPSRRFLAWTFVGDDETPVQLAATLRDSRPNSSTFLLLLWQPGCDQPWRVVNTADRTLGQPLPTDGGTYLVVSGPRNARASGSVEVLLSLERELVAAVRPSFCPPGVVRPPVPAPLPSPGPATVGTLPGSFAVSASGAATYRIPLALPPSRQGVAPSLAVQYSSDKTNGLMGIGFSLEGLSAIERCAKDVYHDRIKQPPSFGSDDRLCLDGQLLVGTTGGYRLERDDFRLVTSSAPDGFRVYGKDGTIYDYGESGPQSPLRHNAVVDGVRGSRAWQLWRVADRAGNFYTIQYQNTRGANNKTTESVPFEILYTGSTDGRTDRPGTRRVRFFYDENENQRADTFRGFLLGDEVRRDKRLSRVEVRGGEAEGPELLVAYRLRYGVDPGNHLSRLEGIQECADVDCRVGKPETTFKWQDMQTGTTGGYRPGPNLPSTDNWPEHNRFVPGYRSVLPFVNVPSLPQSVLAIDMDGDGRHDILYPTAGSWHVLISTALPDGGPTFRDVDTGIHARAVTPFDQDGDGRTDLLLHDDSLEAPEQRWRYVRSLGDHFTGPLNASSSDRDRMVFVLQPPNQFILSESVTRVLDEDGDGKSEILICQPNSHAWMRLFSNAPPPAGNCMSQNLLVMDFQGLGRTDLLVLDGESNEDALFPGTDVKRSELIGRLLNPGGGGPTREREPTWVRVGDFNGDGLQDVVGFGLTGDGTTSRLLLNRGDGGPSRPATFERADSDAIRRALQAFNPTNPDGFSVADIDGDGIQKVVAVDSPGALADFDGDGLMDQLSGWTVSRSRAAGTAPMHVVEIRNGLVSGQPLAPATVQIRYEPMVQSTANRTTDPRVYTPAPESVLTSAACARPMRCHRAGKFLVYEVTSDVGGGTTASARYTYEDARSATDGRGWFGFAKRTVTDLRASSGTTTVTESYNGALGTDHRLAGLPKSVTTTTRLQTGTDHISTTTNTWSIRGGTGTWRHYFPVLDSTQTIETEGTPIRTVTTSQVVDSLGCVSTSSVRYGDGYGVTHSVLDWAPVSRQPSAPDPQHPERDWILCLPQRQQIGSLQPLDNSVDGAADVKTRTVDTTYYERTYLPRTVTREPISGDPKLWLQTELIRDAFGNVTTVKARSISEERIATVAFDPEGYFPVRMTNALGHIVQVRHAPWWGQLLVRQDENGVSSLFGYDAFGWLGIEQHGYRDAGTAETNVTTHTLAALKPGPGFTVHSVTTGGGDTTATFDSLGRIFKRCGAVLGGRSCSDTAYNDLGLLDSQSRPYTEGGSAEYFSRFEYDHLGRILAAHRPNGEVVSTQYTGRVTTTTEANPQQSVTRVERGERWQILRSTSGVGSPAQSAASYAYGAFGVLRRVDRAGSAGTVSTRITTDAYGRRTLLDDPDTACTLSEYSAFDELSAVTDHFDSKDCKDTSGGQTANFKRDLLGRVTRRNDADGETRWTFDTSRNGIGKLASTQSAPNAPSGAVHFETMTYDALSRPQAETVQLDLRGGRDQGIFITSRTYDVFGRVDSIGYPSAVGGLRIQHGYDDASGRMTDVYRGLPAGRRGQRLWHADTVDPDGQLTKETFGNGLPTTRTYEHDTGRQSTIITGDDSGKRSSAVQHLEYTYYPGGNLQTRTSRAEEGGPETELFTYDELDRIRTATTNGTPTLDVAYDALGNITSKTAVGAYTYRAPSREGAFKPHAVSQAGGVSLGYDTAGLLTHRQVVVAPRAPPPAPPSARFDQTIEYTAFGKPRRMSAAGPDPETFFEYNADGERLIRTSAKRRTTYVGGLYQRTTVTGPHDTGEPAETHRYFVYAEGRVVAEILRHLDAPGGNTSGPGTSAVTIDQVHYYHDDHLGSTHVVTDVNGARIESLSYDAFGKHREPTSWMSSATDPDRQYSPVPVGFTGHEEDPFGLVNMGGRVYDPKLGRFLQPDPIVQAPHYTQSLNRYSYVWNNPLRMTDPSGYGGVEATAVATPNGVQEPPEPPSSPEPPKKKDPDPEPPPSTEGTEEVTVTEPLTPPTSQSVPADPVFKPLFVRDGAPQHASIPRVNGTAAADARRSHRSMGLMQAVRQYAATGQVPWQYSAGHFTGWTNNGIERFAQVSERTGEVIIVGLISFVSVYGIVADAVALADMALATRSLAAASRVVGVGEVAGGAAAACAGFRCQTNLKAGSSAGGVGGGGAVSALAQGGRGAAGGQDIIYRSASGTPSSMTPRPVDTTGLSAANSLENAIPGKNQIIDTSRLTNLCATCDNVATGHVSITPKDMSQMQSWINSRGGTAVHPLTIELMNAVIGTVRK